MSNLLRYSPFWMVWNPRGKSPTFQHQTVQSAIDEAERLAKLHKEETFVVLEAVCARRVDDMLRIKIRHDCDIQF